VLLWSSLPAAAAGPTMSGVLEAYNPGARRLQLRLDSGKVKTVVLTEDCKFEQWGTRTSPASFRQGMRVAIRIRGALTQDPLVADVVMDLSTSRNYVATTASSPYYTPTGNYATTAGAGGVTPGLPNLQPPNVIGSLAQGGNAPGTLTNPGTLGPPQNAAFPGPAQMNQTSPGMPAQPSPSGSPFIAHAIGGTAMTPASPSSGPVMYPGSTSSPGSLISPSGPEASAPGLSAMMTGDEDEEGEGSFSNPAAGQPQFVQLSGRLVQADATRRVLVIQTATSPYPQQVLLPAGLYVLDSNRQALPLESLRPGQAIMVMGLANAAGFVEARTVQAGP
jgi:hypothetical protein